MEAENKLYDQMHGDSGQQQLPPSQPPPPQYAATLAPQQTGYLPPSQGYPPSAGYPPPSQGYGSPYPATTPIMASAPYYAPPSGAGYPGTERYGTPAPTQLPQQVTVVTQPAPVIYHVPQTFTGAVIYACFVCWFCNCLFGLIGLLLAVNARDTAVSDPLNARKLGRASYIVSTAGIVVSIVVVALVFGVFYSGPCVAGYKHDGVCYRNKSFAYPRSECEAIGGIYYDGYCYYSTY